MLLQKLNILPRSRTPKSFYNALSPDNTFLKKARCGYYTLPLRQKAQPAAAPEFRITNPIGPLGRGFFLLPYIYVQPALWTDPLHIARHQQVAYFRRLSIHWQSSRERGGARRRRSGGIRRSSAARVSKFVSFLPSFLPASLTSHYFHERALLFCKAY